jgi:thymidylate kinase
VLASMSEQINVVAKPNLAPCLELLFAQFARAGIRYVVLRGADELLAGETDGDIDLLIDPRSFFAASNLLQQLGFVELRRLGYQPHTFYVQYDQQVGWIKLDIVTAIHYDKPVAVFSTDLASPTLEHRVAYGPVFVPAAEQAFMTLWLHCLLDVGRVEPKYQLRLRQLAMWIQDDQQMQNYFARYGATEYPWLVVQQMIESDDWSVVPRIAERTRRRLSESQQLSVQTQRITRRAQRKLNKFVRRRGDKGLIVAFLAPDGAGKTTLIEALLQQPFLGFRRFYMGTNPQESGFVLTRLLGRWRKSAWAKPLWNASAQLEQIWRYRQACAQRAQGQIVLCDRYPSVALRTKGKKKLWHALLGRPDVLIYLDAPAEVLQPRKQQHTVEQIEAQQRGFERLLAEVGSYIRLDADQSQAELQHSVLNIIWQHYQQRQG